MQKTNVSNICNQNKANFDFNLKILLFYLTIGNNYLNSIKLSKYNVLFLLKTQWQMR